MSNTAKDSTGPTIITRSAQVGLSSLSTLAILHTIQKYECIKVMICNRLDETKKPYRRRKNECIATRGITTYAELVAKQATIHVAANVTVSWAWYDQANGVVVWKFQNSDTKQHSVVLLRNGYYFGGA